MQLALTRNERARISDLNVVVADAAVEKARVGFLPVLTFNGNDAQTALVATAQPHNVATGSVVLTQPIINASAYPLYAQAKALAEAQSAQNINDKLILAFNAASGFFAVLSASAVVDAAQRQLENAQANMADTQARAEAQLTSSNDVTRAKVDQAGAGRELEADKGALANAYIQLEFLLNAPVSGPLASPDATFAAAQAPAGTDRRPGEVRPRAQARRPRRQAGGDRRASFRPRAAPAPGPHPQPARYGVGDVERARHDEGLEPGAIAGVLTWTIYDAGSRYADKHSRDAQAEIADLNLQQLVRNVDAQVRSTVALLAAAQAEFQVAAQARDAARQNVDETAILYRQGLAKAIELVDANDSRFTAECPRANVRSNSSLGISIAVLTGGSRTVSSSSFNWSRSLAMLSRISSSIAPAPIISAVARTCAAPLPRGQVDRAEFAAPDRGTSRLCGRAPPHWRLSVRRACDVGVRRGWRT